MTSRTWNPTWWKEAAVILVLALGGLSSLAVADAQRQPFAQSVELSYLPNGKYLKVAVLGYRHIVADLLWLKAVQGLAGRNQTREGYLGAYHAVDVLTDLDPHFVHAYQYTGSIFGVIAGLPKQSVAVLEKGTLNNPTVWQLPFFLGYTYYYELSDPASAAKHFRAASLLPDAPPWLASLAARMSVEANDPTAALDLLQRLYLQSTDEQLKEGIAKRMRAVVAERDIRILEQATATYHERFGTWPDSLGDLVRMKLLERIPPEPFGGQYVLSRTDGSVTSTGLGERLKVYTR